MNSFAQRAKRNGFHYAWIVLLSMCVILSLSAAGINNTGGLFLIPVSNDLGVGVGKLSLSFSVSSVATLLFMPIAGKLVQRYSIKFLVIVASILQTGSFIGLGFLHSVGFLSPFHPAEDWWGRACQFSGADSD